MKELMMILLTAASKVRTHGFSAKLIDFCLNLISRVTDSVVEEYSIVHSFTNPAIRKAKTLPACTDEYLFVGSIREHKFLLFSLCISLFFTYKILAIKIQAAIVRSLKIVEYFG